MSLIAERMQQVQRESRKRRISAWMPQPEAAGAAPAGRILLRSGSLTLLLDSRRGGRLLEFSDRRAQRNLLDTGWVDHLFKPAAGVQDFAAGRAGELSDLPSGPYSARIKESRGSAQAVLTRRAGFGGLDIQRTPMGTRVTLLAERPGLVIGRKGGAIKSLTEAVERQFRFDNPQIEVQEVASPSLDRKSVV